MCKIRCLRMVRWALYWCENPICSHLESWKWNPILFTEITLTSFSRITCAALGGVSRCAPPVWDMNLRQGQSDSGRTTSMHQIQAWGSLSCLSCADSSQRSGSHLSKYKHTKISTGQVLSKSNLSIWFVPRLFNKLIKQIQTLCISDIFDCLLSIIYILTVH